jgi:hypothetical protein
VLGVAREKDSFLSKAISASKGVNLQAIPVVKDSHETLKNIQPTINIIDNLDQSLHGIYINYYVAFHWQI